MNFNLTTTREEEKFRREVSDFLDKEFTRHPAIASIVRKEPPFFTSNHAPFFVIKKTVK